MCHSLNRMRRSVRLTWTGRSRWPVSGVGKGDIVIYRTGRHERRQARGAQCERLADGRGSLPGLYPDCLKGLHERRVALIASDCAHDVLPSPFVEERIPIHVGTEVYMGLLLLHNLELAVLKAACEARGPVRVFLLRGAATHSRCHRFARQPNRDVLMGRANTGRVQVCVDDRC